MDEERIMVLLTKLESGQHEIMRRLELVEESIAKGRTTDSELKERLTRLEERQAFLLKLLYGGGPALTGVGVTIYHLLSEGPLKGG